MADLVFKNFAHSTLAIAATAGDTTLTVSNGDPFPDAPGEGEFAAVLEDVNANREIVRCTSRSGNLLTVTRAQEGTTALAFAVGSQVELRYTADSMDEYFARRGYDGGYWDTAGGGASRLSWQCRRNFTEPGNAPDDMYEGELALNMANAVPLMFAGPQGGDNDGDGVPIIPLVISDVQPANPFDRLLWYNKTTTELRVYDASQASFRDIVVADTNQNYASQAQVDALQVEVDNLKVTLSAPVGTKMVFAQAAAPAGWVQDTTHTDRMLRVVNTAGGGTGGSWTITGLSVGGHALTLDEIPSHDHGGGSHTHPSVPDVAFFSTIGYGGDRPNSIRYTFGTLFVEPSGNVITPQGNGAAHTHPVTGDTSSWRPSYLDIIVATKS